MVCTDVLQCVRLTVLAIGRRCRLSAIHILMFVVCILLNRELFEFGNIVIALTAVLRLLYIRMLSLAHGSVLVI